MPMYDSELSPQERTDQNRFIVFGYDNYYPRGGADDIIGYRSTEKWARELAEANLTQYDWVQIYDVRETKIIAQWRMGVLQ